MIKVPSDPREHLAFLERRIAQLRDWYATPPANRTRKGIALEAAEHTKMKEKLEKQLGLSPRLIGD